MLGKNASIMMEKKRTDQGFTLLEVLIAITIFAVGVLAVSAMQISSISGNTNAMGRTLAARIAADQMEFLKSLPWDDPALADTDGDDTAGLKDTTAADADNNAIQGRYTIVWNVANNNILNNTRTLSVIVTWTERGVQRQVAVEHVVPRIVI